MPARHCSRISATAASAATTPTCRGLSDRALSSTSATRMPRVNPATPPGEGETAMENHCDGEHRRHVDQRHRPPGAPRRPRRRARAPAEHQPQQQRRARRTRANTIAVGAQSAWCAPKVIAAASASAAAAPTSRTCASRCPVRSRSVCIARAIRSGRSDSVLPVATISGAMVRPIGTRGRGSPASQARACPLGPIQIHFGLGGALHDELEARLDVLAHQLGQDPVGLGDVGDGHAQQAAAWRGPAWCASAPRAASRPDP